MTLIDRLSKLDRPDREVGPIISALNRPFCVLFLDGRNEHGSHVIPSFPRSFDIEKDYGTDIEAQAEDILLAAEGEGFAVGDHVWAEFYWVKPQIGDESRVELAGYWEFKSINKEMTAVIAEKEASHAQTI